MAWNRPNPETNVAAIKAKRKPTAIRGIIAGILVIVAALAAFWLMTGDEKAISDGEAQGAGLTKEKTPSTKAKKTSLPVDVASEKTVAAQQKQASGREANEAEVSVADQQAVMNSTDEANTKKKAPVFRNAMDQLLSMVMPNRPGDSVPPLPISDDMKFTEEQEKAMLERLTANDDDSDHVLERKELVQAMRDEYFDLKKRGWTFIDYLKALQAKADLDTEVLSESWKLHDTVFNDPEISDDKYQETLEKINKVLGDRGIDPIKPPGLEDDGEEQQEEPKQEQKK